MARAVSSAGTLHFDKLSTSDELRAGLVKKLKREGYWVRGVGGKLRQGGFSLSQEAGAGVKRATDVHD